MNTPTDITAEELSAAYRRAKLRHIHVSLFKALNTPAIYTALKLDAAAARKHQQHGIPAPQQQAA
jgi:hypothetical protein